MAKSLPPLGSATGADPGGRVADMSLAGTHSAFSVPTDGLEKAGRMSQNPQTARRPASINHSPGALVRRL